MKSDKSNPDDRAKKIQKYWNIYTLIAFILWFVYITVEVWNNTGLPGFICDLQMMIKTDGKGCYLAPNLLVPIFLYLLFHLYAVRPVVRLITGVKVDETTTEKTE